MSQAFRWSPEHDDQELPTATATFPFVTAREALWALARIEAMRGSPRSLVEVDVSSQGLVEDGASWITIRVEVASPDSYTEDWYTRQDDWPRFAAQAASDVRDAVAALEAVVHSEGLFSSSPRDASRRGPVPEAYTRRPPRLRPELSPRMPPTTRRSREACAILDATADGYRTRRGPIDGRTTWVDFEKQTPLPPSPLWVGADYWLTLHEEGVATVDVAEVDFESLAAIVAELEAYARQGLRVDDVDRFARAFLSHELQYGPLDLDRASRKLQAHLLARHDALSPRFGPEALANSLVQILPRVMADAEGRTASRRRLYECCAVRWSDVCSDATSLFTIANEVLAEHGAPRRYLSCPGLADTWVLGPLGDV